MSCPVVNLTKELIRRPSISPNDAGCQKIIIKRLLSIGFTVEYINVGDTKNFWAYRGTGETLVFSGHTDVVPGGNINLWVNNSPFKPIIRNNILFGRGSSDMKGSLAAMIIATERFVAQYPNHKKRLAFIITSDEESSAKNGTVKVIEMLMAKKERIDYCLIGEPTSSVTLGDVIKNGRRGSLNCDLTIHGVNGHVAYSHLAENPIHRATPMLNELVNIKWDRGNDFFPPTSLQIFNIKTNFSSNNMIPSDLFIQFNFRFSPEITDKVIKCQVEKLLKKYQLCYTINWFLSGKPFLTQPGKLADAVINSIIQYNQIKPRLLTSGGTSDGRFIAQMGAQIVELGPVNSTIHQVNECINISDLCLLARIYQRIIEQLVA